MRWSLILSTLTTVLSVLSFVSSALSVPPSESSVELERRARLKTPSTKVKASSKTYRTAGTQHQDAYKFSPSGKVTRTPLKAGQRLAYGTKRVKVLGTHADHVLEAQMVHKVLRDNKLNFQALPPKLKNQVHNTVNGPKNMALIPGHINTGKGQVIKHAMNGNSIKPSHSRDEYIRLSHPTAKRTAKALDKAFKDHKVDLGTNTFQKELSTTMKAAKIPGLRV